MIGIYRFINLINGKSYIGQSIHIQHRYDQHLNERFNPKKNHSKWYRALNKYGIENFKFQILEQCKSEQLNEKEIYWINYYDSFNNGYNSTPGGQSKIFNPEKIIQLWDKRMSVKEIAQELNMGSETTIRKTLKGHENYSEQESRKRGGKNAFLTKINNDNNLTEEKHSIYQYDLNGNFIKKWDSCKQAGRELGIWANVIGKCINGERKSAYNYQWKDFYADKIQPYVLKSGYEKVIVQKDLENNIINTFPSAAEAARTIRGDSSFISRAARNPSKTAYGYKWSYLE